MGEDGGICWVGGLPHGISEEKVQKAFEKCGDVSKVAIRSSPQDTFAFITFVDYSGLQRAIKTMNQSDCFGPPIKVSEKIAGGQFKPKGKGRGRGRSRSRRRSRSRSRSKSISRRRSRSISRRKSRSREKHGSQNRNGGDLRRSRGGSEEVNSQVWIGGLPKRITVESLVEEFSSFGKVENPRIRQSSTDTFAWVEYQSRREADEAIKAMNGSEIFGDRIKVSISHSREVGINVRKKDSGPRGNRNGHGPHGGSRSILAFKMLPTKMLRKELRALVEKYGKVLDVQIWEDREFCRGRAEYEVEKDAQKAWEDLDGRRMEDWDGILRVSFVRD